MLQLESGWGETNAKPSDSLAVNADDPCFPLHVRFRKFGALDFIPTPPEKTLDNPTLCLKVDLLDKSSILCSRRAKIDSLFRTC